MCSYVVGCCKKVGLVAVGVVVDMVDALRLVGLQLEVWRRRAQAPDLDWDGSEEVKTSRAHILTCPIQTRRSEGVGVLGVDCKGHHVVCILHQFRVPPPEASANIRELPSNTLTFFHPFSQSQSLIVISSLAVRTKGCVGWTTIARM